MLELLFLVQIEIQYLEENEWADITAVTTVAQENIWTQPQDRTPAVPFHPALIQNKFPKSRCEKEARELTALPKS